MKHGHLQEVRRATCIGVILGLYWGYMGIMENKMETTIMENQMEKKMENEMETTIMENQMEKKMETEMELL